MEETLPEFTWTINTLHAKDYSLAQSRTRVFLRGLRSLCCPMGMPDPLPPTGARKLIEFLNTNLPAADPNNDMTPNMKNN